MLIAIAMMIAASAGTGPTAELERITQQLLDSIAPGDRRLYRRYLDPALIHVDENNVVRDKAAFLKELVPLPAGIIGTSTVENFKAAFAGDIAVTTYDDQEAVSFFGQPIHTRFRISDTWRHTAAGWRILSEHVAAELKDPPAVVLPHDVLCSYQGRYTLSPKMVATVRCVGDHLEVTRNGGTPVRYLAEVKDLFFSPGNPRVRRVFLRDGDGRITGFADRREGEDAVWRRTG